MKDIFYSVPSEVLFAIVRGEIEIGGAVSFQNTAGVTVEGFCLIIAVSRQFPVCIFRGKFALTKARHIHRVLHYSSFK